MLFFFSLLPCFIDKYLNIFMNILIIFRRFVFVCCGVNINKFQHITVFQSKSLFVLRLVSTQNNIFFVVLNCYFNCQRSLAELASAEIGYFVFYLLLAFDFFYFLIHEQSCFQFQTNEIILMLKIQLIQITAQDCIQHSY